MNHIKLNHLTRMTAPYSTFTVKKRYIFVVTNHDGLHTAWTDNRTTKRIYK
jgi:ribosomal protein S4E